MELRNQYKDYKLVYVVHSLWAFCGRQACGQGTQQQPLRGRLQNGRIFSDSKQSRYAAFGISEQLPSWLLMGGLLPVSNLTGCEGNQKSWGL